MWDNLALVFFLNIGFVLIIAGCKLLTIQTISNILPLWLLVAFLINTLFSLYCGVVSCICRTIANNEKFELAKVTAYFKKTALSSLQLSAVVFVYMAAILASFSFYGSQSLFVSRIAVYFIFWINLIVIFSLQFFYAFQSAYGGSAVETAKKSFAFFMDNKGFSLIIFIGSLLIILLSTVTIFVMFGLTTILLWLNVAVKLRMYKYDFLEENPDASLKDINWYRLLKKDRIALGRRTFRSLLYPWKS